MGNVHLDCIEDHNTGLVQYSIGFDKMVAIFVNEPHLKTGHWSDF